MVFDSVHIWMMRWIIYLHFLPLACSTPQFLLLISVWLARICSLYIMFWNYNSSLILITFWNGFRSPSLHLPFLLYFWDLFFLFWFFSSRSFSKKAQRLQYFVGYFTFKNIYHLRFWFPSEHEFWLHSLPSFSCWEKYLNLPQFPLRSCFTFSGWMNTWDFILYH